MNKILWDKISLVRSETSQLPGRRSCCRRKWKLHIQVRPVRPSIRAATRRGSGRALNRPSLPLPNGGVSSGTCRACHVNSFQCCHCVRTVHYLLSRWFWQKMFPAQMKLMKSRRQGVLLSTNLRHEPDVKKRAWTDKSSTSLVKSNHIWCFKHVRFYLLFAYGCILRVFGRRPLSPGVPWKIIGLCQSNTTNHTACDEDPPPNVRFPFV